MSTGPRLRCLSIVLLPALALAQRPWQLDADRQIELYRKQAVAQPSNAHAQNLLASAYIQKVRESADFSYLERASKIVGAVLDSDSANYEAMRLRSEIEMERHSFARVAGYSKELTRIAPEDAWNWGTLGDALMELGEYERAGKAYERMLTLRANPASYNRMAYYRFITGDAAVAIELMKQAVEPDGGPTEHAAWRLVDLGNLYFKTGQLAAASQAYDAALQLTPRFPSANAGLGRVRAAQGEIADAIAYYRRAYETIPLPDYAAALAALFDASGKTPEARQQLERIDLVDRLDQAAGEKTNRNLAMIYADQDRRLDRALMLVEEELKVRQDVYTYDALAWVRYRRKEYAAAREASDRALKLGTPDPALYYHAGMIAMADGRPRDGVQYLKRAIELNPEFDFTQAPVARRALESAAR